MVQYTSAAIYIDSQKSMVAKVNAINAIIDALMLTAASAASTDNIEEYWLNDGQTQIKTSYRGTEAVFQSIQAFEKLREIYINRLNGRMVRLVDSKNFIGNINGR